MKPIHYFYTVLAFAPMLALAEEDCVEKLALSQKYNSSWVEPLFKSGLMEGVVDFGKAQIKRSELSAYVEKVNNLIQALMQTPPVDEREYKAHAEKVFEAIEMKKSLQQDLSLLMDTEELTERAFVYRFVPRANEAVASIVSRDNLCLSEEEYVALLKVEARDQADTAAEKLLQPIIKTTADKVAK